MNSGMKSGRGRSNWDRRTPSPATEWEVHDTGENNRRPLYHNTRTGQSTFEKPASLKTAAELARDNAADSGGSARQISSSVAAVEKEQQQHLEDRLAAQGMRRNEMSGYLDANAFQQASLDVAIPAWNRGYKLLQKMGWKEGMGLGRSKEGMLAPINPLSGATEGTKLGLGKANEYNEMSNEAAKERRKLDVEIEQTKAVVEKKRLQAQKEEAIKVTLQEQNREFYCEICDKQYRTVGEMSNHLSSYDHHHKKRFDEMKKMQRGARSNQTSKKRQREKKREEAEMRKRMAAAGVKMGGTGRPAQPPQPARAAQPQKIGQQQQAMNPGSGGDGSGIGSSSGGGSGSSSGGSRAASTPASSSRPAATVAASYSVEDIMRFYREKDQSKADRETAEFILGHFTTDEITHKMIERYGVAPKSTAKANANAVATAPIASSSSGGGGSSSGSSSSRPSPAAGPGTRFTKEQIQEFYEIHDETKADEETAEFILENFSTQEIIQNMTARYGTAPKPKGA